jgi:predicted peroxiredoxin
VVLFANFYFVVADAAIVGGQEVHRFFSDDGGFTIWAGEAFDGFQRRPQRFNDHFDDDSVGLREHARFDETVLCSEMREDTLVEVAKVIGKAEFGCAGGPEADDHFS